MRTFPNIAVWLQEGMWEDYPLYHFNYIRTFPKGNFLKLAFRKQFGEVVGPKVKEAVITEELLGYVLLKTNLQSKVVQIYLMLWCNLSYHKNTRRPARDFCYKESSAPLMLRSGRTESGATWGFHKGRLVQERDQRRPPRAVSYFPGYKNNASSLQKTPIIPLPRYN